MSLDFDLMQVQPTSVFSTNITHNLGKMASEAGIYYALWRPEEINVVFAKEIIPMLERGLCKLKAYPDKFKKFDAENGWGTYEHFIPFVEEIVKACREFPDAEIRTSK